jgi:hypothetical protein
MSSRRAKIAADLGGHAQAFVGGPLQRQLPLLADHPQCQAHQDGDREEEGDEEERDLFPMAFGLHCGIDPTGILAAGRAERVTKMS